MPAMESRALARQSVTAEVSEFYRAELEAFVDLSRHARPHAWALVEKLQNACLASSPATLAGFDRSVQVLEDVVA